MVPLAATFTNPALFTSNFVAFPSNLVVVSVLVNVLYLSSPASINTELDPAEAAFVNKIL